MTDESRSVLTRLSAVGGILAGLLGAAALTERTLKIGHGFEIAASTGICLLIAGATIACASLFPRFSAKASLCGGYCLLMIAGSALAGYGLDTRSAYTTILSSIVFVAIGAGLCRFGWKRLILNKTLWLTVLMGGGVAGVSLIMWAGVASDYRRAAPSSAVPNLMLFATFLRAAVVAIAVFLWRNSRDRLSRAETLNSSLHDKVAVRTAQLHAIFEAVQVGTWSYDLGSGNAVWEGKTNEIFGFSAGRTGIGIQQMLERIQSDDREKVADFVRRAAQITSEQGDDGVDLEFRVIWPDRSVHWVLARGGVSHFANGKAACLSGITLDITRLKDAELALQKSEASVRKLNEALEQRVRLQKRELVESEKRFRLMVEGLNDYAFFMLDTDGKVMSWNLGAERISGYLGAEIIGKHFSLLSTPEDVEHGHPQEELKLAAEKGQVEETGWMLRRDGSRFWANVVVTAVRDDAGELCGFSQLTRDITERKISNEQLEEQRRKAEESSQAKSQFLASMSHEIRTPMNAILGMADLLWDTEMDADQRHYVEIFRRAGATLMELINDILDLSKIESGRLELEKREFDAIAVANDVVELLLPKACDKKIGLRSRIAAGVSERVIGDAARLRQVLMNLAGNAIKFTNTGEVVVSVEPAEGGRPGELKFAVSDTGIGIPADKLSAIFEAFTQADASTTRNYGGTGLGLTISKRLVECMGGHLGVQSEPGAGSVFYFTSLFGTPEARPSIASLARSEQSGVSRSDVKNAKILVAEDSPDNRFLIQAYLKNAPYRVTIVPDGKAALQQVQQEEFDAVLMDIQMPVLDGLSATRAIREFELGQGRKPVPILAITANTHREDVQATRDAGCTGHLPKPISKAGLLRTLRELLNPDLLERSGQPSASNGSLTGNSEAPRYLSACRKELPEMVALLAASEFEQISTRGRNMKGAAHSYGFADLTDIGGKLEKSAQQGNAEAIDKQLLRLANYLDSFPNQAEQVPERQPVP